MQAIVSALNKNLNRWRLLFWIGNGNRQLCRQGRWKGGWKVIFSLLLGGLSSCQSTVSPPVKEITIQQKWELEAGDEIANHLVTGSLGDVSIALKGDPLYAPFNGEVEPSSQAHCLFYSTPDVPAYLFRFCGLKRLRYGPIQAGKRIGVGDYLHFATLRRQPDDTWIIVEPSTGILERAIDPHIETAQKK